MQENRNPENLFRNKCNTARTRSGAEEMVIAYLSHHPSPELPFFYGKKKHPLKVYSQGYRAREPHLAEIRQRAGSQGKY